MLAEIKNPALATDVQKPGTAQVGLTVFVTVADPPSDPPTATFSYDFEYDGKHTARSVWIVNEFADFTLTLEPDLPADYLMTFAPLNPDGSGPITWLTPGGKDKREKPDFVIQGPDLSDDQMTITFTVQNDASPGESILVSFALNVVLTAPDGQTTPFTSPDPTIINVDPTGGVNGDAN